MALVNISTTRYTGDGKPIRAGVVAQSQSRPFPSIHIEVVYATADPDSFEGRVSIGGRTVATTKVHGSEQEAWHAAEILLDQAVARLFVP